MNNAHTSVKNPRKPAAGQKMKEEKKEMVFSELNSLLSSGLDFSRSFRLLIDGESDQKSRAVLQSLYDSVVKGSLLWQAVESSGKFTPLDQGVIRIGEETGCLGESLEFLSSYYRKKTEQKRMLGSALRYPLIVLSISLIVVIFMMAVIVPMFEQVYSRMGGELPGITQTIIRISKSFPVWGTILALAVISVAAIFYVSRDSQAMKAFTGSLVLNTPFAGDIMRKNYQSHFCKLLHLLTRSGVPLLTGVEMLYSVITFYPYRQSFDKICEGLRRGELLSSILAGYPKLYDKKLVVLVRVGEETNRLSDMFERQGNELTKELEFRLQRLGSILEPVLVLFVGILVAVILISMYMPMFKLGGIMG